MLKSNVSLLNRFFIGLSVFCLVWLSSSYPVHSQQVLDRILAIIDEEIILLSDLNEALQQAAVQLELNPQNDREKIEQLRTELLNRMIDEKVLLVKATEDTIEVKDNEVEQTLENRIQQMIDQYGSEEAFNKELLRYGLTLKDLKKRYRDEIRNELLAERVMQLKIADIDISRREVEEFYATYKDSLPEQQEAVRIAHLLLEAKPGDDVKREALGRIQDILNESKAGADFAKLAEQYSEGPSASVGGDLGFFGPGTMVPEFERAAFALDVGEVSQIVETQFGYHIIKLEEKRGNEIRVRHILIKMETGLEDEERAKEDIENLKARIDQGEDFGALVREYSEDPTTAPKGGELGWFYVAQIPPLFKTEIESLDVDQVSAPIKSDFGYHLITILERREGGTLSLENDWDAIKGLAKQYKVQDQFQTWLRNLREKMYVEVRLED
ncbi:MAG: peptidylprolyl isomerase [Gemmatimonadota bacterium]|nr:MAG: peptidylprolyl isomerase [Gemmatimonadota bacterium]